MRRRNGGEERGELRGRKGESNENREERMGIPRFGICFG
jgi:hypothetical protein